MSYPDNNPKTIYGVQKVPLHLVPPVAIAAEAHAFGLGAQKYGPYNWRDKTVSSSVYYGAALRHLMAWWDGEDTDPESGKSHLGHVRACLAILLDAGSVGKLNDDRPMAGAMAQALAECATQEARSQRMRAAAENISAEVKAVVRGSHEPSEQVMRSYGGTSD